MRDNNQAKLYALYQEELNYIRKSGNEFAKKYPKAAGFLELGTIGSYDPHVERLIEAFAFLSARVQFNLDEQFPEIVSALLNVLYPQFSNPIPAMSIAHFQTDPVLCDSPSGFLVSPGTQLFSQTHDDIECEFKTCYPTQILRLEVTENTIEHPEKYSFLSDRHDVLSVLKIRLTTQLGNIEDLKFESLRFYLNLPDLHAHFLYELLFCHTSEIVILNENQERIELIPTDHLTPVGFEPDESVLPCPNQAYHVYNLITEYFTFERKFLFFDLKMDHIPKTGRNMEILIAFNTKNEKLRLQKSSLLLGCTPIINLFYRKSEPFKITQKDFEYDLIADKAQDAHVEIHSIENVSAFTESGETINLSPVYSTSYLNRAAEDRYYWLSRRQPTINALKVGTDVFLSFLDKELNQKTPLGDIIYADTICTNRYATNQVAETEALTSNVLIPTKTITCLTKPTQKIQPPLSSKSQWNIMSVLTFNHLYLLDQKDAIQALRDILHVMSFSEKEIVTKSILGIKKIELSSIVKRIGYDAWREFCPGTRISLLFDRSYYSNSTPFLFACVLERFFAQLTTLNSFTQLVITDMEQPGEWKKWPPRTGSQQLI